MSRGITALVGIALVAAGAAAYITKDRISTDLITEIRSLGSK